MAGAINERKPLDLRGRPPIPPRPERPLKPPTGGRFEARGARDLRGSSRQRSPPRRMKSVSFVKYGLAPAAERAECVVHGAPPPRERGTAAPSAINGSTPLAADGKPAQDAHIDLESKEEKGEDDDEVKEVLEVEEVDVDAEEEKKEAAKKAAPAVPVVPPTGPKAAAFLFSEEGVAQLEDMYGLGLKLLRSMGWCPGRGVGSNDDGELEPVSVDLLERPSTHYGRKDRRCLGRRKPKRFRDSDESSPSRTPSSSSSRSSSKSSRESSKSSSRSRKHRRKRRRPTTTKRRKKSRSKSSSRSSSSSSSSSSRDKKRKARKKGFTNTAPTATEAAAAAGAAAAQHLKMPPAPAPEVVVKEDPETAIAKKRVLAKLTELQKVEPKEQRAKEFRALLRDWHPDKNPEKKEMATAVFQFLQKGKSLLNLK